MQKTNHSTDFHKIRSKDGNLRPRKKPLGDNPHHVTLRLELR